MKSVGGKSFEYGVGAGAFGFGGKMVARKSPFKYSTDNLNTHGILRSKTYYGLIPASQDSESKAVSKILGGKGPHLDQEMDEDLGGGVKGPVTRKSNQFSP